MQKQRSDKIAARQARPPPVKKAGALKRPGTQQLLPTATGLSRAAEGEQLLQFNRHGQIEHGRVTLQAGNDLF